uniref:Uncharacterized protein n=1 Tax=Anguilla anguilla TaxID=7936 RepID=A0A0E9WV09_ANGAN
MLLSVPTGKCGSRGALKTPGEAFSMRYFKAVATCSHRHKCDIKAVSKTAFFLLCERGIGTAKPGF